MDDIPFPPEFVAEYEVLEVAGAGGMARVYRARQRATEREVAIKVLAPQAFSEEDSRRRFERERELTSSLKHPNIVPLLSYGDAAGRPYLVFEFIDGQSLRDMLQRERRIPLVRSLRYARQIAQGLAAAHAAGIVHRDLKPDNVLVARSDDEARVADFGLARETTPDSKKARLTQAGIILGTPGYLSPEMIRGDPAGPAGDLFALGVMLFEMITGCLPLDSQSEHELLIRYLREDLPPISSRGIVVPQRVERLVASLLRRDVARRPDDAAKVAEALGAAEAKGDAIDGPSSRDIRIPRGRLSTQTRPVDFASSGAINPRLTPLSGARFVRQHPRLSAAAIAMIGALVVGGLAGIAYLSWPAPAAPATKYAVQGNPTIIAGVTSASIRWNTNQSIDTQLWIRSESAPDSAGKAMRPPAGAPPSGTHHELTVRGLTEGQRWMLSVVFPDGTRSPSSYPLELKNDLRSLVENASVRYQDAGSAEITFDVKAEVTAGVLFANARDAQPVWAPSRGPRRVTLTVPIPVDAAEHPPVVLFRELDDAAGENTPRNRVELPRIVPLDSLRKQVTELFSGPSPLDLTPVTAEIFRHASKFYGVPRDRSINRERVRKTDKARRDQLTATARATARQRLLSMRGLDLDLVAAALPFWRADAPIPPAERRRLHAALMRLADLDGACELVTGGPMIGFDRALGLRVPASANERIAEDAFRPLDHYQVPIVQQVVKAQALPLFTHSDFGDGEGVVGLWVVANEGQGVIDALRAVSITAKGDPKGRKGMLEAMPDLPPKFPVDGPLRITMVVSSTSPEYRIWLRIGRETDICFRSTLADFKGFGAEPLKEPRKVLEERTLVMVAELPAGYVEPGARTISVRLEAFPTHEGGLVSAPMVAWLLDCGIVPIR